MSLEFATSIRFKLRATCYITRLNRTSDKKVIVARICSELTFSNTSISICYGIHSDIREKGSCRWILLRASVLNLECVGILRDSIGLPSKKLVSFEFAQSFYFQFRVSRYITRLNRTSKLTVIIVWISYELPFSILSVSIYYGTQLNIR